ncbi:MAG: PAS domain S-box protein [Firmicutes bacterium]|nr:PAS domain S-box protein [Bacillota bacterium]
MSRKNDRLGNYQLKARDMDFLESNHKQVFERINFFKDVTFPFGEAVIATDPDNRVTHWNDGAEKLYGIKSYEARGRALGELFIELPINPEQQKTGVWQGESIHIKKTGEEIYVEKSVSVLKEHGHIAGYYYFIRDITSKKKMNEVLVQHRNLLEEVVKKRTRELEESDSKLEREIEQRKYLEEELNLFFNLSIDAFLIIDTDGIIKRINPLFAESIGYEPGEITGIKGHRLIHREDYQETRKVFQQSVAGDSPGYLTNRVMCRDGTVRWVSWIFNPYAEKGLVYITGRDVTEQKKISEELTRLDRLNMVGEMAAGIGHEIRNPMTTIRGFLQMLGGKDDCKHYKEYFDIMVDELDRANSIITEFLSMAKNKVINLKPRNLNAVLETMFPMIQADALMKDKDVTIDLDGRLPDINLDESEIRQLILNLARNGLEAMAPGGVLSITTSLREETPVLAIKDQGTGISPEHLDKLGTPFFTTKEDGTGLGLAVCYSIAARHAAEIELETSSQGTTFYIKFPSK